jgi:hypothetical protein
MRKDAVLTTSMTVIVPFVLTTALEELLHKRSGPE